VSAADLELIGIWLLVGAVLVIVLVGVLAALWSLRLARKSRVLSEHLVGEQARVTAVGVGLLAAIAEAKTLW